MKALAKELYEVEPAKGKAQPWLIYRQIAVSVRKVPPGKDFRDDNRSLLREKVGEIIPRTARDSRGAPSPSYSEPSEEVRRTASRSR